MCIHIPSFFVFPSHLDYHRALSRVPCAIQCVLFRFLFYTEAVYMSILISQFIPPSSPQPWYPYVSSLHLCFYFYFANKSICIIFLDSTYKQYYTTFVFLFLTYFV